MMAQKIREGWKSGTKLSGTVEIDETYIGGFMRDAGLSERWQSSEPSSAAGRSWPSLSPTRDERTLIESVQDTVVPTSTIYTDGSSAYRNAREVYTH